MLLILLAYLGGVLTIVSPCILPVLPFVFARADRSFTRSALPMLSDRSWARSSEPGGSNGCAGPRAVPRSTS